MKRKKDITLYSDVLKTSLYVHSKRRYSFPLEFLLFLHKLSPVFHFLLFFSFDHLCTTFFFPKLFFFPFLFSFSLITSLLTLHPPSLDHGRSNHSFPRSPTMLDRRLALATTHLHVQSHRGCHRPPPPPTATLLLTFVASFTLHFLSHFLSLPSFRFRYSLLFFL